MSEIVNIQNNSQVPDEPTAERGLAENMEQAKKFALYDDVGEVALKLEGMFEESKVAEADDYYNPDRNFFEEVKKADALYQTMNKTLDILDQNRATQQQYNLVNKSAWSSGKGFVEEMYKKGNVAVEIDVRPNAEGEFVLTHWGRDESVISGEKVGEQTTAEVKERGKKDTLDDVLGLLAEYQDDGNHMIIEVKDLGEDSAAGVAEILNKLKKHGVEDSVAIASLEPSVLAAVYQIAPEIPLIVNKKPVFAEKTVEPSPFSDEDVARIHKLTEGRWAKLGPLEVSTVNDDKGETVLVQTPEEFYEETGLSKGISGVFIKAGVMKLFGHAEKAAELVKSAVKEAHAKGMDVQISTWGDEALRNTIGKIIPGLDKMASASEQIKMAREAGMDENDTIYAHDAVAAAEALNKEAA
ncbi:MAG: hypothetical protein LBK50_02595 [Candidatus Nomurabacteria bacterium]|jgi:glycerophosphoryl diester phosphodiesterase|nr:hypothetical protein [Candidatus Nomurabacteria bacterium]